MEVNTAIIVSVIVFASLCVLGLILFVNFKSSQSIFRDYIEDLEQKHLRDDE